MAKYEYMILAAKDSKDSAELWFRYLRKMIFRDYIKLSKSDVTKLLNSNDLNAFQKLTLKYAVQKGTPTYEYVVSLNEKKKSTVLEDLMEKYKDE